MSNAKFYYQDKNASKPNKPNHIGACTIIIHNDKVLMELRSDSDYWSLIGGGLKINERLEDCAVREIYEETGLIVDKHNISLYKIY